MSLVLKSIGVGNGAGSDLEILIVDDDPFALKLICFQLKKLGFTSFHAYANSAAALEYMRCEAHSIALILCDLQMPEIDGIEFIQRVVDLNYKGGLIFISGEDARTLKSAQNFAENFGLMSLGALGKPVKSDHLEFLMRDAVKGLSKVKQLECKAVDVDRYSMKDINNAFARGELVNFYQPKVDLISGSIPSVEALVRWQHPVDGLLAPFNFLNMIEFKGMSDELLSYLMVGPHGILPQLQAWRKSGIGFSVAVNLSDINLSNPALPNLLTTQLKQFGLEPDDLLLEISEKRTIKNRTQSWGNLTRLSLRGFRLSIDDFGTGQSSMADLRDLPLAELKFDRSYTNAVHRNEGQKMALKSCLRMAEELNIRTVAEGIEDIEDWHCVRNLGCSIVQGFLVAKPMPAADISDWLAAWGNRLSLPGNRLFPAIVDMLSEEEFSRV
jgi:EAL domain-containing protein (putative c-di-GMP-specific phosphodiesterase class I)/ActR/RegA family two-component response regulator